MSPLPHSAIAFLYQSGLDRIRDGFRAATASLEQSRNASNEAHARYVDSGEDDSEYDEDGCLIHSTAHALRSAGEEADYALLAVREAFIMAAFHYWERWARTATGLTATGDRFDKVRTACAQLYPVSEELEALNYLNNLLKHGSAYSARKLAEIRVDHFWMRPSCFLHDRREHWALGIGDGHVEEAFEIVRASGPQYPDSGTGADK